ncbi:MAG: glycosyltransferase family 4 protein [Verrucomicrobia bacterium]|nr:glycosyltransferase family 4 protein [Verrucomicrobiota bacterium]
MMHAVFFMANVGNRPWRIVHSEASLGWGGQERRVMAELLGFRARGHAVGVLAPERATIFAESVRHDLPRATLAENRWAFPFAVARASRWLRAFRADVVNTHSSRDGWTVGLAARLARVPLIIRSRHFDVPVANPWLSRHVYATLADHLITTSPKVAADFRALFHLPEDRVTAISTGVDIAMFSPVGPKAAFEFPADATGPLVGIIGVIRYAKGHAVLFEAMKLLGEQGLPVRCVVVGDSANRGGLERRVVELGLSKRVLFVGQRDDVPAILRALDALAIPSLHEAIPQVGLQALATKTPVVASKVGGIPSIIRPGETGRLCAPKDAASLASALREALTDKATTQAMCERGRVLVEREHTVEVMLDRLEDVYRSHLS